MTDARPMLIIGNKRYSSWSLRPWMLLAHHGVAFDEIVLPLDTPEFAERIGALSPSRRVPALRGECPMNVCRTLSAPLPLSAAAEADVARVVALWQDALDRSGGPFLFGGFGIVDAFFAPVTTRLTTYAIPVPAVARTYIDTVQALPAFRRWVEDAAREPWRIDKYERIGLA